MIGAKRLQRLRRISWALFSSQFAYMLEYRAEIALWALSGVLPLIMLALWQGAAADQGLGLSYNQLSRYFIAAFVVRQFTVVWLIHVFEEDVLQGKLSPLLLQPVHPLWRYFAAHVAEQATRIPFVAVMLTLLAAIPANLMWWPGWSHLLLAVASIIWVFVLRFLLQSLIAMLCFWSERAAALDRLMLIPYLFLSGLVAPLQFYPTWLQKLAACTPFPSMVAFPASLLAGEAANIGTGFAALAGWCAVLLPASMLMWKRGVRRYAAMGA